ncbi:VWA domain-containing protein [Puteibacter caeruleilacunae]|nr:VWA domain-containing protein [Puteibacter caeruleilacunae]
MRKLPIFFLIDLSESMVGEPIELVRKGMESLIRSLKKNPYALETVWIEIIGFAGKARTIEPFEELALFYPPEFPIGGGTSIGSGLEFLMKEIDANVKCSTAETKGDWKPLVFIFTDGQPTDDFQAAVSRWQSGYKRKCQTLLATIGNVISHDFISSIADDAIQLENDKEECFDSYFKWLTDSIASSSVQASEGIEPTAKVGELECGLSKIDLTKQERVPASVDDNYSVILGACQKTQEKYLIKYKKGVEIFDGDFNNFDKVYRLEGAYRLDYKKYKDLSVQAETSSVDAKYLQGIPTCPYCGSKHAFAVCMCGGVFCVDLDTDMQTCGWCGTTARYEATCEDFNIERRQG